jgi:hypothetical protein
MCKERVCWGNTWQIGMGKTAQHNVTSHYTANNFAEAKIIKHISTTLQNQQINNG